MKCPVCGFADSKVIDSRHVEEGNSIRRRRECLACQKRYTTFEIVETVQVIVTKKNGTKELFDRNKLLAGLLKACQKRPVNAEEILVDIENEIHAGVGDHQPSGCRCGLRWWFHRPERTPEAADVGFQSIAGGQFPVAVAAEKRVAGDGMVLRSQRQHGAPPFGYG